MKSTQRGVEALHVTAQTQRPLFELTKNQRLSVLTSWEDGLRRTIEKYGGEVVPGSLSLLGQTVEALIPVTTFETAAKELEDGEVRIDLMLPRSNLPEG